MAYTAQTWTNGVSKLNATRLTVMETGISDIHNLVTAKGDVYTATASGAPARLAVGANNTLLVADSAQTTGNKWASITNAMVDAAAAIAYSKLNLALSIVNADIATSAAIDVSKLAGAYTSYTPAWTSTGVAPAIGNGTLAGRYIQIGKHVHVTGKWTAGGTTTFGTGDYRFSLPVANATDRAIGIVDGYDSSAFVMAQGIGDYVTSTTFQIVSGATFNGTRTNWGQTFPYTWASGDFIAWNFVYEAV